MQGPCSLSFQYPPDHQEDVRELQGHSIATQQMQSLQAILSPSHFGEPPHHSNERHVYYCTAEVSIDALQQALKSQVLRSLRVLREISKEFCELNLEVEIINGWVAEIEGFDATLIPVGLNPALLVLVPFETLNQILAECVMASGPTRGLILRSQALELLKFIQTYAEKYHLFQNSWIYLDIGRWMEILSRGKHVK